MKKATRDLVIAKIRQLYPGRNIDDVLIILDRYGELDSEKERHRVHLAILKLCDEQELIELAYYVKVAKADYRDLLAWAEFPNELRSLKHSDPEELEKLRRQDLAQYREWLKIG